jgi:hypothetical protein
MKTTRHLNNLNGTRRNLVIKDRAWRIDPPARIRIGKEPAKYLFWVITVEEKGKNARALKVKDN